MQTALKQILDILELGRVYEQIGSQELAYVDVCEFFQESVALVSDSKGINIRCECEGVEVLADSLLKQLMYNLIDNTVKYGEKTTKINFGYKEEKNQLKLVYEDNGVGITNEVRAHLFEKGFGKGTGFGLYMIKRIVEAYGWAIEENGEQEKGARFTIQIPTEHYRLQNCNNPKTVS